MGKRRQIDVTLCPRCGWPDWRGLGTTHSRRTCDARIEAAKRLARATNADFEHGQWWITSLDTGAQWSVVDASGRSSIDGFLFEQVTNAHIGERRKG